MANAGLTGWHAFPATIRKRTGELMSDYAELRVHGFGGIASSAAGCVLTSRCPACGMSTYAEGYRWNLAARELPTNGPDFIAIWPLYRRLFCSDRARSVLESFNTAEMQFVAPGTLTEPLRGMGDTPVPPYFDNAARAEIEAFWARAPQSFA